MDSPESPSVPQSHLLYAGIERMVLWGESREAVMDRLRVNGVNGVEADAIHATAHRVRIDAFRQEFRKRIGVGVVLILIRIGVVTGCWFGLGFNARNIFMLSGLLVGIGFWKPIRGALGYSIAASREVSLADDF